jgi:hypothetical protein
MTKNNSISFSFRQFLLLVALLSLGANLAWAAGSLPIQSTDFASLFNQHRVGQPTPVPWAGSFFPYGYDGTAVGVSSSGEMLKSLANQSTPSPMMEYERVFSTSRAQDWEKNNHTCSKIKNEVEREGCEAWWGHCNGWSAAAIKEQEPRKALSINGGSLSVSAQKGILTEYWLESSSYFEGDTNKSKKTNKWIANSNDPDYQGFWDVTPRQFFLLVTNYLGIQKTGIVIDRFTGEQVWNQPLVGYRVLPIDTSRMEMINISGKSTYRYLIEMKIFWANDGVHPGHVSRKFNVQQISDSNDVAVFRQENISLDEDYSGRMLKFYLFFDAPLKVSSDRKTVQGNPRMVGDGFWLEQQDLIDNPGRLVDWEEYNQGHPDFVWMPINGFETGNGYRNPMLLGRHVEAISRALAAGAPVSPSPADPVTPPPQPSHPHPSDQSSEFKVVVLRTDEMRNLSESAILAKINEFFVRAGIAASILDFQASGMSIRFEAEVSGGFTADSLKSLLTESGFKVLNLENK